MKSESQKQGPFLRITTVKNPEIRPTGSEQLRLCDCSAAWSFWCRLWNLGPPPPPPTVGLRASQGSFGVVPSRGSWRGGVARFARSVARAGYVACKCQCLWGSGWQVGLTRCSGLDLLRCGRLTSVDVCNFQTKLRFRYLERLVLLHGRWNYRRACMFTLFTLPDLLLSAASELF